MFLKLSQCGNIKTDVLVLGIMFIDFMKMTIFNTNLWCSTLKKKL